MLIAGKMMWTTVVTANCSRLATMGSTMVCEHVAGGDRSVPRTVGSHAN
jgi:hypothetical protein